MSDKRRRDRDRNRRNRGRSSPTPAAVAAAVAIVLAGGAAAYFLVLRDDSTPGPKPEEARAGSVELAATTTIAVEPTPEAYSMRIRQDDYAGGEHTTSTEELTVERPFASTRVLRRADGEQSRFVTTFARSSFPRRGDGEPVALQIGPSLASGDVRLEPALVEGMPSSVLRLREVRRVAGRPCRVYRANGPVGAGPFAAIGRQGEYADLCIDASGLLLEQLWVVDDRVRQRRLVLEVEILEPDDVEDFTIDGELVDQEQGGGSVRPVDPASRPPGEFWSLVAPPDGFTRHGRYAIVHPVGEGETKPDENERLVSVADVFVDGPDLLVVEQAASLDQRQAFPPLDPTRQRAEVPGLGAAELVPSARTNEARVLLPAGRAVRAYGTVPLPRLVEVLRALVRLDGPAELVFLD